MKEKGYTLIEVLGVVVILGLLVLIAFPKIINSTNNSLNKTDDLMRDMIYKATDLYIKNNSSDFEKQNNASYCLELSELVSEDYLKSPIKISDEDITNSNSVQIIYKDGYKYEIVDKESCVEHHPFICKAVTEETKTVGNVPLGLFNSGDEYICNVDGINNYHFFVLSTEGDKINLIMNRNICGDGTLANGTNSCTVVWNSLADNKYGPITALDTLLSGTSGWGNIPNININYNDEGNTGDYGYKNIITNGDTTTITKKDGTVAATYENLKARLPKKSELSSVGCSGKYASCPIWLVDYLASSSYYSGTTNITGLSGYWTLTSHSTNSGIAWIVGSDGYIAAISPVMKGIRPVINVSKLDILQ